MDLINDFFKVIETVVNEDGFMATIELNPGHIVYSAHFPGYPVTPGVIQLQIVHELLEKQLGRKLKLKTLTWCKFLKILNPEETSQIVIYIKFEKKEDFINVQASGKNGADVFFKLRSNYF